MATLLNTSTRMMAFPIIGPREKGKPINVLKQFNFVPGSMVMCDADELKALKARPDFKNELDAGHIVEGTQAKKVASDVDKQLKSEAKAKATKEKAGK